MRCTSRSLIQPLRLALIAFLVAVCASLVGPLRSEATIFLLPDPAAFSSTNPGAPGDYTTVWREGWGNDPLAIYEMNIPQPSTGEPAIVGAFYYLFRPGSTHPVWRPLPSSEITMTSEMWPLCYNAILLNKDKWDLFLDIPGEHGAPGPLFGSGWAPPAGVSLAPGRPYEGPYGLAWQYFALDTTTAAWGYTYLGLDMTPPNKVTGLKATPGYGTSVVNGWLTQSRVHLTWDDVVYDRLSGTGYFELYMDGAPYQTSIDTTTSRRVYDLKEHYPDYGYSLPTSRLLTIEDLPAGQHQFQIRAVDRATNEGPLSDPITLKVDPDIPTVTITSPATSGQKVGVKPVFTADVLDRGGVAKVEFYVDGVLRATDLAPPYSASLDLTALPDGSEHVLTVRAVDVVDRENSAQTTFMIDKTPTVTILSPAFLGATLPSPAFLCASVQDGAGIANVVLSVDGSTVTTYTPSTVDETSTVIAHLLPLASGVHTFTVTVSSVSGGVASASQRFQVDTALPISTLDVAPPVQQSPIGGTSTTNPYVPTDPVSRWREMWGSSLQPNFTVTQPTFPDFAEVELFYTVDRAPIGTIDPDNPATYYRSVHPAGTETLNIIDQLGVLGSNPILDGTALYPGKAMEPVEGVWYWHVLYRLNGETAPERYTVPYGIDRTAPAPVTGLSGFANSTTGNPISGWLAQDRIVLKWDNNQQDLLSGTAYYRVYRDGTCIIPGDVDVLEPTSGGAGVPWYRPGRAQETLTIEDIGSGRHKIQVTAVDRAGNESAKQSPLAVAVDSDAPQISIINPASTGALLGSSAYLSVATTDAGGVYSVNFAIDGTSIGTLRPSKETNHYVARFKPVWSRYSNGKHRFTAKVTDMVGRQVTASRDFVLDKTAPSLSIRSAGPSLFYPRLRDGIKDNYTVKFKTNSSGTASMRIYDSKGKLKRVISKSVKAGTSSLTWNGKHADWDMDAANQVATHRFTIKIRMVDKAGNTRTSKSYKTSIRFYEIVKTGGDTAKVEPR